MLNALQLIVFKIVQINPQFQEIERISNSISENKDYQRQRDDTESHQNFWKFTFNTVTIKLKNRWLLDSLDANRVNQYLQSADRQ